MKSCNISEMLCVGTSVCMFSDGLSFISVVNFMRRKDINWENDFYSIVEPLFFLRSISTHRIVGLRTCIYYVVINGMSHSAEAFLLE